MSLFGYCLLHGTGNCICNHQQQHNVIAQYANLHSIVSSDIGTPSAAISIPNTTEKKEPEINRKLLLLL